MLSRIPSCSVPELELKFQLGIGAIDALDKVFPPSEAKRSQLRAVYFDTDTHALRDAGFSLRVRGDDGVFTQTLKHRGSGGLFERDEWETGVPGPDLDLDLFAASPAGSVVSQTALEAAFTVSVERRLHIWSHDDVRIQVTVDTGAVSANERLEPVAELELELLAGTPGDLFALARQLLTTAPLTLSFASKAERGYRLAGHDSLIALGFGEAALGPNTSVREAFQTMARDSLTQIAGNGALLRRSRSPAVLHQMRIGLRRFRTALVIFKPILDSAGLRAAREDVRWLAGELAAARDIDVFLENLGPPQEFEERAGRAAFLQAMRLAQTEAHDQVTLALGSRRYDLVLLSLGEWIEAGAWREPDDKARVDFLETPLADFAPEVMDRLHRRCLRASRGFERLDVTARHDLRKQAKVLRYASAFLGNALGTHPKRWRAYMSRLRTMLDHLGVLNDFAVAQDVVRRAIARRSPLVAHAAGLELGRMSYLENQTLMATRKSVKAYRDSRVFWSRQAKDLNYSQP